MDDSKSRRVPNKLLPRFPLSEEQPQRVPLQMPGEMRPGSFKVATKTPDPSSPSRPEAAAAPAGLRSCGVDAVAQSRPGLDEPPVQSWRGRILTLTQPLLPWGHPDRVGKGTAVVRVWHRAGNRGTCSAAAGSRVPHRPSRSALAPQLRHQAGEPPAHRCGTLGQARDLKRGTQPWLQEGFLPPVLSPRLRPCMNLSPTVFISKYWTRVNHNLGAELNADSCSITPCI